MIALIFASGILIINFIIAFFSLERHLLATYLILIITLLVQILIAALFIIFIVLL